MAGKADRSTGPAMEGRECLGRLSFIYPFTHFVRSAKALYQVVVCSAVTRWGETGQCRETWVHAGHTREGFPEEAGRSRSQCELEMSGEVRLSRN